MTDRRTNRAIATLSTAALLASVLLGVAGPAAGSVLFRMNSSTCALFNDPSGQCLGRPMPQIGGTVNGPTLMTTPTANGRADFTIPAQLYSVMASFTLSYGPYPYAKATYTRYNNGGSMMANAWTPNVTKTFVDKDTIYPYVTASPGMGFIRAKIGPNGIAGANGFRQYSYYTGTYLTPGINYFIAVVSNTRGGATMSTAPSLVFWSYGYNLTNMTNAGVVGAAEPNIWAFTGTVTISQPDPGAGQQYIVASAQDNRTAAGASGTIQVITASLAHNYNVTPLPPPFDGTATPTQLRNNLLNGRRTTFDFIPAPEPGQIALIGMGVVGLAGVWRMRRR